MNRKQRRQSARRAAGSRGADGALDPAIWRVVEAAQARHRSGDAAGAVGQLSALARAGHRHPAILSLLGAFQVEIGQAEAGLANSREAAALAPGDARILANFGGQLLALGYTSEALPVLSQAVGLAPDLANARFNLARAQFNGGDFAAAADQARRYLDAVPDDPAGHRLLVHALVQSSCREEAEAHCLSLIARAPELPWTHVVHIDLLVSAGQAGRAAARCRELADEFTGPAGRDMLMKAAEIDASVGKTAGALDCYGRILAADPSDAGARHGRATLLLSTGALAEGAEIYATLQRGSDGLVQLPHPVWRGEDMTGKTLLVRSEQGIGEQIMFASLFPELLARGVNLVIECDHRLVPTFERSFPGCAVFGWSNPPQRALCELPVDAQTRAGDLLPWLRRSFGDFPWRVCLLAPDAAVAEKTRAAREESGGLVVGISWRSSSTTGGGGKSVPLLQWRDVLRAPNVRFVNLQYGATEGEVAQVADALGMEIHDPAGLDRTRDVDRLISFVSSLDLVITVSNVTAHFAGAVGTPAWVLVPKSPLWHWFRFGRYSPWYSSVRLYRQADPGDWTAALGMIADDLRRLPRSPQRE